MSTSTSGESRLFYGWYLVATATISVAAWFGTRSAYSVYFSSLLADFGWPRGEAAGAQSMAMLTYSLAAPLIGWLVGRLGPRVVIAPGVVLLAVGFFLCARIESLAQFYLYYGLVVGLGVSALSLAAYTPVLANWFQQKRGLVSGITTAGIGLGTVSVVPASQFAVEQLGWRGAFTLSGLIVLAVLFLPNLLILRLHPREKGLFPDGLPAAPAASGQSQPLRGDRPLAELLREKSFWALILFPAPALFGVYVFLVHFVRFAEDAGLPPLRAAFLVGLVGIISSTARILWGWLSDRLGRETVYSTGIGFMCAAFALLLLAQASGSRHLLYLFVPVFGLGWGALAPMIMASATDLYAGANLGLIYGLVEGMIGVGAALGSWTAGFVFDLSGSYAPAFWLAMACCALSGVLIWVAAPRKASLVR